MGCDIHTYLERQRADGGREYLPQGWTADEPTAVHVATWTEQPGVYPYTHVEWRETYRQAAGEFLPWVESLPGHFDTPPEKLRLVFWFDN